MPRNDGVSVMPVWLDVSIGVLGGLVVLAVVFWFTFARMPGRRSDGGLTHQEPSYYWNSDNSGDSGGGHSQ
jgi:hypothetical protein